MDQLTQRSAPPRSPSAGPGRWAVRWQPAAEARLRLFCLPHAGGGAAVYRHWAHRLAPDVEVVAIRLPGRETRLAEPPLRRVTDIVTALVADVEPWLDRPHAWFGHSLGALVAFETCQALRRARLPEPARLFVSSRLAPHLPARERPVHGAPLHDFIGRLRELNGTPPDILADHATLVSLLPMLRADFAAAETYAYRPASPLDCPISVYGSLGDPFVTIPGLHAWQQHTSAHFGIKIFSGDHFFLHQPSHPVLSLIADVLGRAA